MTTPLFHFTYFTSLSVSNITILEEEIPSFQIPVEDDGDVDNRQDHSIIEIHDGFFPLPTRKSYKPLDISGMPDPSPKTFKREILSVYSKVTKVKKLI